MSHIVTIDLEIHNLEALKSAAARLDMEFREGQTTYRWFGTRIGNDPLPPGMSVEDLGRCEHAIAIREAGAGKAYEVGVVRSKSHDGYTLVWDFWRGGFGLREVVGDGCGRLMQAYALASAKSSAAAKGWSTQEVIQNDGSVRLTLNKRSW